MQLDEAKHKGDERAERFGQLLTPVVKAFLTDKDLEAALLAQQVLGGHGYVKEWGMEQIVRDARIAQIYGARTVFKRWIWRVVRWSETAGKR